MALVKEKRPYVMYVTRSSIVVGGDSIKEPIVVDFATGVFFDLEFPNVRNLNNQVLTLVEQFDLRPTKLIFILSEELYFSQTFASTEQEELKGYISLIPFSEVITKQVSQPQGQQLFAVSKEFVDPLVEVFTHHGFSVLAVVPAAVMGEQLKSLEQFNQQVIDAVSAGVDSFEPYSFYTPPKTQEGMTSLRDAEGHIFNPRLVAMIVFLTLLIGVLVMVLVMNGYLGAPKKAVVPSAAPVTSTNVVLTQVPSITEESSESAVVNQNEASESAAQSSIQSSIPIEILTNATNATQASRVLSSLSSVGFRNVLSKKNASIAQKTLILYSPTVTQSSLDAIVKVLRELGIEASAQENPDLGAVDVRILVK